MAEGKINDLFKALNVFIIDLLINTELSLHNVLINSYK